MTGAIDFIGEADTRFSPEEGRQILNRRAARPDLSPDPRLPAETRLWAALQQIGGGTWGGCVYDTDAIMQKLAE